MNIKNYKAWIILASTFSGLAAASLIVTRIRKHQKQTKMDDMWDKIMEVIHEINTERSKSSERILHAKTKKCIGSAVVSYTLKLPDELEGDVAMDIGLHHQANDTTLMLKIAESRIMRFVMNHLPDPRTVSGTDGVVVACAGLHKQANRLAEKAVGSDDEDFEDIRLRIVCTLKDIIDEAAERKYPTQKVQVWYLR